MRNFVIIFVFVLVLSSAHAQEMKQTAPIETFGIDVLQLQISEMERVVKEQTNTIEKLNHTIIKMQEEINNLKVDMQIRLGDVEAKTANIQTKIGGMKAYIAADAAGVNGANATGGAGANDVAVSDKTVVDANTKAPKEIYDAGMKLLKENKFAEAQTKFEEFLKVAPKNNLAGNAKYWLGESYYARGDYTNAAVVFASGIKEYPDNIKTPDNLLKLGISMKALKKDSDACTAFLSIKAKYPKTDKKIIGKAEKEIKNLKCK